MSQAPKSVKDSLERMIAAAHQLADVECRITPEEMELLGECHARLRLIRTPPVSPVQPTVQSTTDSPLLGLRLVAVN